ncbi:histidine phosphotransferase family protein [Brevirhabdus sp.]|uniref:histidine phosphotransferase family protein n=1 Tax=Brevirhabdus sp. TaxID=2004514 RepID=UPI0040587CF4
MADALDYAGLVSARICHDIVNPLGAIGNGLELLMMETRSVGPELALMQDSFRSADAKVRFLRVAFGHHDAAEQMQIREAIAIAHAAFADSRVLLDWAAPEGGGDATVDRARVRAIFLALQCVQTALPFGGECRVAALAGSGDGLAGSGDGRRAWRISGHSDRLRIDAALWDMLGTGRMAAAPNPAQIHFLLLAEHQARWPVGLHLRHGDGSVTLEL